MAQEQGEDQLDFTCQNFESERQEIRRDRKGLKTRREVLDGCRQDFESAQHDRVLPQEGGQRGSQQDDAGLETDFDFGRRKLSQARIYLRIGRHQLESDRKDLAERLNELKMERKRLQDERLEFERAQMQAELDLSESRYELKREREQLQEERRRFEHVQIKFALANVKNGLSLAKRSKQLDKERLEMDQQRQELDRGFRELAEEGGWSFGDEDEKA
jgi:hypothetical protein